MKKILFTIAALVGFAIAADAQSKSIGGRIGNYGVDVSYENYAFGGPDFLEFELGLDDAFSTQAFHFDGIYNFMIVQPDWTPAGTWGFYAGPGASVAVWENGEGDNVVYAGIVGNVGLEYTFEFPLSLSVDFRPRIMVGDGKIRENGPFTMGIGVRYVF